MNRLKKIDNDLVSLLREYKDITEREVDIINSRIVPYKYEKTLQQLADKWEVSRERIRQVEAKLLEILNNIV